MEKRQKGLVANCVFLHKIQNKNKIKHTRKVPNMHSIFNPHNRVNTSQNHHRAFAVLQGVGPNHQKASVRICDASSHRSTSSCSVCLYPKATETRLCPRRRSQRIYQMFVRSVAQLFIWVTIDSTIGGRPPFFVFILSFCLVSFCTTCNTLFISVLFGVVFCITSKHSYSQPFCFRLGHNRLRNWWSSAFSLYSSSFLWCWHLYFLQHFFFTSTTHTEVLLISLVHRLSLIYLLLF